MGGEGARAGAEGRPLSYPRRNVARQLVFGAVF